MTPESIRILYGYNYWAFDHLWDCVMQLTDEQFVHEADYSIGSIRNHVVHMMRATRRWMLRIQNVKNLPEMAYEDFTSITTTRATWDEIKSEIFDYVYSLNQAQLDEVVHWEISSRNLALDSRRWEILLHVANHLTDHRSQVLVLLNQHFGMTTFEQDMVFYLEEIAKTNHQG